MTEIIKRLGHKAWFDKRDKKLPITAQVVNKNIETLEDFMPGKTKWTTEKFIEEKIPFNKSVRVNICWKI